MKLPFITTTLIFIAFLMFHLKRTEKKEDRQEREFWEREYKANTIRRKDIEHLDYIEFALSMLPIREYANDPRVSECIMQLRELEGKKILNCTGYSNTDLKLKYGTANITKLSEYDLNYTTLVRNLALLAEKYLNIAAGLLPHVELINENAPLTEEEELARLLGLEDPQKDSQESAQSPAAPQPEVPVDPAILKQVNDLRQDAKTILEYSVSIDTDVRLTYELLGKIYASENNRAGIEELKQKARTLNSLSKEPILRALEKL